MTTMQASFKLKILTIAGLIIFTTAGIVAIVMYHESQSEVNVLIQQQKANSIPYQWLTEAIASGELTRERKRHANLQVTHLERSFKRIAKDMASKGATMNVNPTFPITAYENPFDDELSLAAAEEIAMEKIKEYSVDESKTFLKSTVYADYKLAFVWGLTGYSTPIHPIYLISFEGVFSLNKADIDQTSYSYALLKVNPQTGGVNVAFSAKPQINNYGELQQLEYQNGGVHLYY